MSSASSPRVYVSVFTWYSCDCLLRLDAILKCSKRLIYFGHLLALPKSKLPGGASWMLPAVGTGAAAVSAAAGPAV